MKKAVAGLCFGFLVSCSGSNFTAPSKSGGPAAADATPAAGPEAPQEEAKPADAPAGVETQPISTDSVEYKQCLLAVGGDAQSVVAVTQGDVDLSKITPNSVLYLKVQGQAKIDLTAKEIATLKGVCIEAAGQANLILDLNSTVNALFYFARGEASTALNFRETGSLAKLLTDVSGQSSLSLTGQKLACEALKLQKAGAALVECNGAKL